MTDDIKQHCKTCRHHSCEKRDRQVHEEGADDMELGAFHDGSPEDIAKFGPEQFEYVYSCVKQGMKRIGLGDDAGVGCDLYEIGRRASINPRIAARIAELEAKEDADG